VAACTMLRLLLWWVLVAGCKSYDCGNLDVVFILDGTSGISAQDWAAQTTFLKTVTATMAGIHNGANGRSRTKVSIATNPKATLDLGLTADNSALDFKLKRMLAPPGGTSDLIATLGAVGAEIAQQKYAVGNAIIVFLMKDTQRFSEATLNYVKQIPAQRAVISINPQPGDTWQGAS